MNAPLLLTLNAGSSSLKFSVCAAQTGVARLALGQVEGLGTAVGKAIGKAGGTAADTAGGASESAAATGSPPGSGPLLRVALARGEQTTLALPAEAASHAGAVGAVLQWLEQRFAQQPVRAVSHRVVHGGPELSAAAVLDSALLARLQGLVPLAPLHQPHNLAGIAAAQQAFAQALQVACFDTAFHRSHPWVADTFALPRRFYDEGIRRYGFHGLSYQYIARRLRACDAPLARGRVVVAHLGNGASMCALRDGRSMASTMGFSTLDGLPMGTRCGQLDPGVLLYLMETKGMGVAEVSQLLYHDAGLKGLSGESHDVRRLLASGTPAASNALAYFADRARRELGALAAGLGGLDGVVLTGGIGEHAVRVRAAMLADTAWMGVALDEVANAAPEPADRLISAPGSRVRIWVMQTDEEQMLAEHAAGLLGLGEGLHAGPRD